MVFLLAYALTIAGYTAWLSVPKLSPTPKHIAAGLVGAAIGGATVAVLAARATAAPADNPIGPYAFVGAITVAVFLILLAPVAMLAWLLAWKQVRRSTQRFAMIAIAGLVGVFGYVPFLVSAGCALTGSCL